jgi:hypothetical protein
MSGSPIVLPGGSAVGVVCIDDFGNPLLEANLPAWMVRDAQRTRHMRRTW